MKRVMLVCPASPTDMPYLRQYLDFLDFSKILYDIVYPDCTYTIVVHPKKYFTCRFESSNFLRIILKVWGYYKYSRFVIDKLSKGEHSHVITMGIACSIFLCNHLKKNYKSRYIYDIRDYSQILRISIFKYFNHSLLKHSYMNVISSNGFKQWLPSDANYTLCHNTTLKKIESGVSKHLETVSSSTIKIVTIGQVRDLAVNTYIIEQLGNKENFELIFAGKGMVLEILENIVRDKKYTNILFIGGYRKEEEDDIVENATLLNVCMENNMISNYLLSNRLYLAARLQKPLISFDGCYQADIINTYNLGVIVKRMDNLSEKVQDYISSFDSDKFVKGCRSFLEKVTIDLTTFNNRMLTFLKN